jgi:hypothetical protein
MIRIPRRLNNRRHPCRHYSRSMWKRLAVRVEPRRVVLSCRQQDKQAHLDDLPLAGVLYRQRFLSNHYSVKVAGRVRRHGSLWAPITCH